MADNCLEALVALGIHGLPQFNCAIGRGRDEDPHVLDLREDELSDLALVRLRGGQLDLLVLLTRLDQVLVVHTLLLVVQNLAIRKANEHELLRLECIAVS